MLADATIRDVFLIVVGGVGLAWYFLCLFSLGVHPPGAAPTAFRQFQGLSIATISAILATFVGLQLGIKAAEADADTAAAAAGSVVDTTTKLRASAPPGAKADPDLVRRLDAVEKQAEAAKKGAEQTAAASARLRYFRWGACSLYLLSLCLAVGFWWWHRNGNPDPDPAVVNLARSLLGVLAGALAGVLAVQ